MSFFLFHGFSAMGLWGCTIQFTRVSESQMNSWTWSKRYPTNNTLKDSNYDTVFRFSILTNATSPYTRLPTQIPEERPGRLRLTSNSIPADGLGYKSLNNKLLGFESSPTFLHKLHKGHVFSNIVLEGNAKIMILCMIKEGVFASSQGFWVWSMTVTSENCFDLKLLQLEMLRPKTMQRCG